MQKAKVLQLKDKKSKAEEAEKQIRQIISDRLDDTNKRIQSNRQTDRIVEAINNK